MAETKEQKIAHRIIARLFDLPVRDMGGGLRVVSLSSSVLPVEERDLIVRLVSDFAYQRKTHGP